MSSTARPRSVRKLALGALIILLLVLALPAQALAKARSWRTYSVKVDSGYLALRTYPSYDEANEIAELYTGDVVSVIDASSNSSYWKVVSSTHHQTGWVNKNYLVYLDNTPDGVYRVHVASGYLALRERPSYSDQNEIGALYTGDTVTLLDRYNSKYWWVYSPKLGRYGYVNKNYLDYSYETVNVNYGTYSVKVNSGYLALRTAPYYNENNEIGELYTGDTVTVKDKSNGTYWWVYSPKYNKDGYVNKNYLVKR